MSRALAEALPGAVDATPTLQGPGLHALIVDEVFANATVEQALSFFVAVGWRLAAGYPLPDDGGLPGLERALNEVWHRLGLGRVTLAMKDDGIAIDHAGATTREHTASPSWPSAAAALLQGAYGAWFGSIGGEAALRIRIVRQAGERIILHYGL